MTAKIGVWIALIMLLSAAALAIQQPHHLKILAVQENGDKYEGSDADIYLELIPGSGRVFLETTPLIKADTQISTRFAKDIACKHFKLDCNKYDFIFTIHAKSNIIGGPSASAAIAALTTIAVLDVDYNQKITVTGTINSGGIVGPVGGVQEKLEAASKAGITKVLISKGSAWQFTAPLSNQSNSTALNTSQTRLNVIEYAKKNLSIDVVEVMDLDEVIMQLTGKKPVLPPATLIENQQYVRIMSGLQNQLCQRTDKIEQEMNRERVHPDNETAQSILNKKLKADNATRSHDFYSAASFCFGANIQLKTTYYQNKKLSSNMATKLMNVLEENNLQLEQKIAKENIETISDLQTLMIVQERVNEVKTEIEKFKTVAGELTPEELSGKVAYAEERFYSALSWMQFFSMDGRKFIMDNEKLHNSCLEKISEAEEWTNYAGLFLGNLMPVYIKEKIDRAKKNSQQGEYPLCLITASQAKADANVILNSLGLSEDAAQEFLNSKQKAVERVIAENSAEGIFPILGYSYYQYALSLQAQDKFTSLVYLEYALEMSDLSIYFPEEKSQVSILLERSIPPSWIFIGEGMLLGIIGTVLVLYIVRMVRKKPTVRKKKDTK